MADFAKPLPAAPESVTSQTQLIQSTQTLGPEGYTIAELNKEMDMDMDPDPDPFMSTKVIEADTVSEPLSNLDDIVYVTNGETDELSSSNRKESEVAKPVHSVALSSSSWLEDGYEKPAMVGAGLANLVNTCFFNAVLQCFTHSVLLVQGLYSHTHPTPCDCSNERFCLICVLREHIELSLSPTAKIVSPWKFIDNLSYFSSSFQRYQQEDAHEFLQCFLDRLESSLTTLKTKDENLVKQVFGGRVISKLRCCNCNHISDTYEPSVDLSLEIKDVNTLSTALESFTKVEHIEDEEMKFTCDNCNQKVSVSKQLMLDKVPPICAFHLKRFKNDGSYVEKVDKHVEFPLDLDLQPYTCGSEVDLMYELYAVVVHAAFTSSCGHYYCYVRYAPDAWYMFDDSKVISVSEARVLSEEAYILFYAKQGTPWFSNFMETYKPSFYPNLSTTTSPKSVLENVEPPSIPQSDDVAPLKPITNVVKENTPLIFKEYGSNHKVEAQKNASGTLLNDPKIELDIEELLSPPRSPGLDISDDISDYKDTEVVFAAKPKQLKLVEKATYKRQRHNVVENSAKLEAMKMCKRMPGSRGSLLMAAMSSQSENSLVKKSKKMVMSPRNNGSKSTDRFNRKLFTSGFR